MLVLLFIGELILLYIISQGLTQAVFDLTVLIFRARSIGITVISILTFPGTVIHELSHMFTAEILGVRTGKLTLIPEGIESEEVKTGSVMISHSDPFRRYAIGLAPIVVGMIAVTALSYLLSQNYQPITIMTAIYLYLLLAVSNAMFSSKEDLKGFIPFAIALAVVIAAAYIAGLRIGLTGVLLTGMTTILNALTKSLGIVLTINFIGFALTKGITLLVLKLTRRRLIHRSGS